MTRLKATWEEESESEHLVFLSGRHPDLMPSFLPVGDDAAFLIASYLDPHTIRLVRFIHPVFWELAASREWGRVATSSREAIHSLYERVRYASDYCSDHC